MGGGGKGEGRRLHSRGTNLASWKGKKQKKTAAGGGRGTCGAIFRDGEPKEASVLNGSRCPKKRGEKV